MIASGELPDMVQHNWQAAHGGAGLEPDNHRERDGSLKYYFSEKTRDNDFKGVGPFLMLAADYCL